MTDGLFSKAHIREALLPQPSALDAENFFEKVRSQLPARIVPAAVLVPLVERGGVFSVLLTQRAATLRDHAGQISFPGGRIEADDADAWAAALREAYEEIGLDARLVEFAGYLPDHMVISGFRVTPAVGFVSPAYELKIATEEVHDVFEVPLDFIFDEVNHRPRARQLGSTTLRMFDIPWGDRNIWGATSMMLLTLRQRLMSR